MKKFSVSIPLVTWVTKEVTAEDEDDAIDKAIDDLPYLCAQCSGWGKNYSWDISDLDFGKMDIQPGVWEEE